MELLAQVARFARNSVRYTWHRRWVLLSRPVVRVLLWGHRRHQQTSGVTVLIANWHTTSFLCFTVERVVRYSPSGTRVVVVDNASRGAERVARGDLPRFVRLVRLPFNVGHGVALDLAAGLASTEYIVSLDVDAFPIDDRWLERLQSPLREGFTVSGAGGSFGQIAPCCLMMSLDRFIEARHTFTARFVPGNDPWLRPAEVWDVGRAISLREGPAALYRFERTGYLDPASCVGEIFDDLIYHNGYATVDRVPAGRGTTTKAGALEAWRVAVRHFDDGEYSDRSRFTG